MERDLMTQHHMQGTSTVAIAAVERASASGQGLGPIRIELESELRGLALAARMHGYFIALTAEGQPTIVPIPGRAK